MDMVAMRSGVIVALMVFLLGASATKAVGKDADIKAAQWADSVMNTLSWEQRIAQLMMVAAYSNRDDKHIREIEKLTSDYGIGGVIFFQGGPVRQALFTNRLQKAAKISLLVAMDAEWGPSMRLDSVTEFPWQMMMAAATDSMARRNVFTDIAHQLNRLGVTVSFSPVVDINSNAANPVIGARSFGDDRQTVTNYGLEYIQELSQQGIMPVAKHFPGHGDTDTDSHLALPVLTHSAARLDSVELYPFRQLIGAGVPAVMIGHMHIPAFDTSHLPSTLSKPIVTDLLKNKMAFDGLVFTDALNMKGVSGAFAPGTLEVRALAAGSDILLMPSDVPLAIDSVRMALLCGRLDSTAILKSCRKVLMSKYMLGLYIKPTVEVDGIVEALNRKEFRWHRDALVQSAITVARNESGLLPLQRPDTLRMAIVLPLGTDYSSYADMLNRFAQVDTVLVSPKPSLPEILNVIKRLEVHNLVICPLVGTNVFAARRFGLSPQMVALYDTLLVAKAVVLDVLTSPYSLSLFANAKRAKAIVVSYHDKDWVRNWSAQLIFGGLAATGHLPVTLHTTGLTDSPAGWDNPVRLQYTYPEAAGLDGVVLSQIDSLVNQAIANRATPGCQVLVARHGKVVYHKSFGCFTYLNEHPVQNNDLYDLASLTKVLATLPVTMKLYETGQIDLRKRLSVYLPRLEGTDKEKIHIEDILTHQARLQPWIPFYLSTLQGLYPEMNLFSKEFTFEYPYRLSDNNFMAKQITWRDSVFSREPQPGYSLKLADGMYMQQVWRDTVFAQMDRSALRKKKEYKYSDLGFLYMQQVAENVTNTSLDKFAEQSFFSPLGASSLVFNPLQEYSVSQIAPTENDMVFRRQVVHGFVHDPAAAMLGGVAGHAGLFGNANDVAKVMQMFLNRGTYGGKQYFTSATVDYFTSCVFCHEGNRRALGFDKPLMEPSANTTASLFASPLSYGHTGFTGTMVWADPATGLLYVFLSNRVHPDAGNNRLMDMNLRTKIHDIVYQSILPDGYDTPTTYEAAKEGM